MLRKLPLLVAGLLLQATLARAQSAPLVRTVFAADSMDAAVPALSPDEKWVVFARSISNQENRLLIQAVAGGEPRELLSAKGLHWWFTFTPAGDRLIFTSSLPRRDATDWVLYLVSAPFDTRTGTLTGPPRQISLEGMQGGTGRRMLAISPDGQSVAYVAGGSFAIKVIPVSGGAARTLVEPPRLPEALVWSPDGQFLSYELADPPGFARMQVSRDGGTPIVMVRSRVRLGPLSPDGAFSFNIPSWSPNGPSILRAFGPNGQLLGEVKLPPRLAVISGFAVNGKYIVGSSTKSVYPVKVVPVAGGQVRQVTARTANAGWSENGDIEAWTQEDGYVTLSRFSPAGEPKSYVRLPDEPDYRSNYWNVRGIYGEFLIYHKAIAAGSLVNGRLTGLKALNMKDGSRGELADSNVWMMCCDPGAPRRMSIEPGGREIYYVREVSGNRMQLRATRVGGESRLIGEYPMGAVAYFAPGQSRGIYRETIKDSVRLQLIASAGRPPQTLAMYARAAAPEGFTWSLDGRQLAAIASSSSTLNVYRFDRQGNLLASDAFQLPFNGSDEISWLPDGSGLVMLAQVRGVAGSEVALVKLADPQHPTLLAKDDPSRKFGLVLSQDGKHVVYQSEQGTGSAIHLINVAEMMKQLQVRK